MNTLQRQQVRGQLLAWVCAQYDQITPEELANALEIESLSDEQIPVRFREAVTDFRHLRHDARVAACTAYLEHCQRAAIPNKPL